MVTDHNKYSAINLSARSVSSFDPGLVLEDVQPKPLAGVVGVICQLIGMLHLVVEGVKVVILYPPIPPHLLVLGIWSFSQVPLVTF